MRESPESGVVVDTTEFPIVFAWFGRTYSESDWEAALSKVGSLAEGNARFVVINVTRPDMQTPTARQRKAVADFNDAYVKSGRTTILGWGSIVESHVLRGVLTAISWLTTFPYDQKSLATFDEAIAWAKQLLANSKA